MLISFFVSTLAIACFSILMSIQKRELLLCGFIGGISWVLYHILQTQGLGKSTSVFFASLVLTILSRAFAVIRKTPATIYLLPGSLPMVPGAGIYYSVYNLIHGTLLEFASKGIETLATGIGIVFGILIGFFLPQKWFHTICQKEKAN